MTPKRSMSFAKVAKDFERLYQDNVELKDAVERVSAKLEYYQQMESTMQNTLVIAQETADEVKRTASRRLPCWSRKLP